MPNWCTNSLTLKDKTGKRAEEIANALETDRSGFFQVLRPMPKDVDNIRDWAVDNWGCKWDATIVNWSISSDGSSLEVFFDTPWSPPLALYDFLISGGWQIEASFAEPGVLVAGRLGNGQLDTWDLEAVEEGDHVRYLNLPGELEFLFSDD